MTRLRDSMLFNPRIRAAMARQLPAKVEPVPVKPAKPRKYRNVPTIVGGIRFDSKAEAKVFTDLKRLQQAGEVLWFIRQPSFDLAGGIRYRADFLAVYRTVGGGQQVRVIDKKGKQTAQFKLKMRLMAEAYPNVTVELW